MKPSLPGPRGAVAAAVLVAGLLPAVSAAQTAHLPLPLDPPPPTVITVGPLGSGATYDDLQAAIDAAPAGAVITVSPGEYDGVVVAKPLRIVGAGSASTFLRAQGPPPPDPLTPAPPGEPALRVAGLATGEAASIAGFTLVPPPGPQVAVRVEDCAGSVRLIDLVHNVPFQVTAPPGGSGQLGLAVVDACSDVLLQSCHLLGQTSSAQGSNARDGLPGVHVAASRLTLVDCTVRGNAGLGALGSVQLGQAAPGVRAVASELALARSTVRGADGGIALFNAGAGAPALLAYDSKVIVAGGPGAALLGGTGKINLSPTGPVVQPGGSAAKTTGGALTLAIDAGAIGGLGGNLLPAPAIAPQGTQVKTLLVPLPTASLVPTVGAVGAPVRLQVAGVPLTPVWPWFSAAVGVALPLPLPGAYLPLELDLGTLLPLGMWFLGLDGRLELQLALPSAPSIVGLVIAVQVLGLAGAEPQLSSPTVVALGQ